MRKPRSKYTRRADGRIVRTETIDGKRVYFYGHTDAEVDSKYEEYIHTADAPLLIKTLVDEWWEKKEAEISPNTVSGFKTAKSRKPCNINKIVGITGFFLCFAISQSYPN